MNRFWGHTISVAVLAAGAGSAVPACAHNDASLFVHGVLAPPIPNGGECTYTADSTAPGLSRGTVDAALRDSYAPLFLIGNNLIPRSNASTPSAETSRIEVQGAIVQVVDPATNQTVEDNTVLTSAIVEPGSGSQPSYTALGANIMDAAAINHFANTGGTATKIALVYVTFYGVTLGGQSIQSNQYQFPVDVCLGCLVSVPAGAPKGYCSGVSPAGTVIASTSTAAACELGQDQVSDCQACSALPVCANLR